MLKTNRQPLIILFALTMSLALCPVVTLAQSESQKPEKLAAVLLFISSETTSDLMAPVSEVRESTIQFLHDHLASQGFEVLPAGVLDAVVGYWRVRDDWAISRPFLAHLDENLAVQQLHVFHLQAEISGLAITSRVMECPAGELISVETISRDFPLLEGARQVPDTSTWLGYLGNICRSFEAVPAARNSGNPLLLLPAEGIGCDSYRSFTATTSVLKYLLASSQWSIPDPSLVNTLLSTSGINPTRLGQTGRHHLQKEFQCDNLLKLSLVTFGFEIKSTGQRIFDDDQIQTPRQAFGDFDLTLSRINLSDGAVTHSRHVFVPAIGNSTWFGLTQHPSPLVRIDTAALKLWQAFNNNPKDN